MKKPSTNPAELALTAKLDKMHLSSSRPHATVVAGGANAGKAMQPFPSVSPPMRRVSNTVASREPAPKLRFAKPIPAHDINTSTAPTPSAVPPATSLNPRPKLEDSDLPPKISLTNPTPISPTRSQGLLSTRPARQYRASTSNLPQPKTLHSVPNPARARAYSAPQSLASVSPGKCIAPKKTSRKSLPEKPPGFCLRPVASPHPLLSISPDAVVDRVCVTHHPDFLKERPFDSLSEKQLRVDPNDWIHGYLSADTKISLSIVISHRAPEDDVAGYIYAYEIPSESDSEVRFKIGRARNRRERIAKWKKCEPWPRNASTVLKKGKKTKYCRRLEKLVHLELADLVCYQQYLNPGFIAASSSFVAPAPDPPRPKGKSGPFPHAKYTCGCGVVHETFTFTRIKGGGEWERIIAPIIEKWGRYVEMFDD
ncbi:hypothetical protein BOTBODRAFT_189349 [Botryobasidium botryosum FD-172 SS1]|uniref:Bacteriophage T5 Orf172 DNA-binding domain-containing protein n=1 Tax=Botryobasidium botryosum (strain FD-172 SS1) TaxID=930990 RepID=A0A067MA00_BOTB1|nr:hypothetical protein BOTBODRAFT_189349 [Botryobasidium botryosum FD-172 SS1]